MTTPDRHPVLANELAQFIAAPLQGMPDELRRAGLRSILNSFAASLGAARTPTVDAAVALFREWQGDGQGSVIGRTERLDPMGAAFVNGLSANYHDFDDTHLPTVIHPAAPVIPALMALAERRRLSGRAVLEAFLVGGEVECRLGLMSPGQYQRGWHITATCGVFGAAAGSARLLGLDGAQTAHALGIAASQSAGIVENLASGAKNVAMGNAARNGLLAALLAERGYTAAPQAIEGRLGWARAMGDEPVLEAVTSGLGERWEIAGNTFKPYPCGIVLHSVIDACLLLREKPGFSTEQLESVLVVGHPLLLERADRQTFNERDAKVSLQHGAAVAFCHGEGGLNAFSEEAVADPEVARLRALVRAEADAGIPVGAARVSVRMRDRTLISEEVVNARGSLQRPLSDQELDDKLADLAARGGTGCDPVSLTAAIHALEEFSDMGELMQLARPR